MATQYSNKPIVTNGLVYALDFGNQKSYVSGSNSAFNLVYSTTTSSLNSYNSGQKGVVIGNSYQFNVPGDAYVSSSYFLTQALTFLDTASEYTVTVVVEPKAGNYSGEPRYLASNLTATGRTWGITYGTSGFTQYGINDGNTSIYSRQYPVGTSRQHVTYRYKSGSFDFFVNGVPVSASAINPSTFFRYQYGGGLTIGSPLDYLSPTPNGYAFSGSLGLFYVYNRALSSNEIYSNYLIAAQRYGFPTPAKPYSLDENAYLFLQSAGITDPIITGSINTFVLGLKSASLWDKMIAIYPFVGTGSVGVNLTGSHRWNLKEPSLVTYPLSFTGSWNGSVSGSTPSGSGTNITAGGITPSTVYPNYSSSNAHISILSYDTPTSSSFLAGTGIDTDTAVSTLAGDYGTPAAAYSVRKVRTAYSGALMDVRRSIDNVTSSIGYVSNGDLDTGSLLNFVRTEGNNFLPGAYSGLAAAYSLRRVSGSYTGSAIDVRRSDNVTSSIGFDASGNLNTSSLLSFAYTENRLRYSEQFDNAYWAKAANITITADAITAPDGTLTADLATNTDGGYYSTISVSPTTVSGSVYTYSIYVRSGSSDTFDIRRIDSAGPESVATITSISASTFTNSFPAISITSAGNDFKRVAVSFTASGTTNNLYIYPIRQVPLSPGTPGSIYLWGAQFNSGSTVLPYLQTTTNSGSTYLTTYVTQWYDQSGNNRHATQTATGSQPLIVSSGSLVTENGKPALRFLITNSSSLDLPGSPLSGSNAFGLYAVANFSSSNVYEMLYAEGTTAPNVEIRRDGASNNLQWITGDGTFPSGTATIDNRQVLVSINRNALVSNTAFVNGTLDATLTTSSNAISSTTASIGKRSDGYYFDGTVQEMSFFTGSAASSSRALIENNINNYYSIYTGSNNGFVARWYDQSGNNNHATQTATGSQPIIVLSGSVTTVYGKPTLTYNISGSTNLTFSRLTNIRSLFMVVNKYKVSGSSAFLLGDSTLLSGGTYDFHDPGNNSAYFSSVFANTFVRAGSLFRNNIQINTTGSSVLDDTSVLSLITTGNVVASSISQDRDFTERSLNRNISELTIYSTDQNSNRAAIDYGINNYYNIYPQTSSFTTSSFTIKATPTGITGAINNQPLNGISSTGPVGFITVSRTGSNALTIARNGVTSSFTVPASGALSTGIYLGASNYNGITVGSSPLGISFASVGTGLSNSELLTYKNLVNTLQTSLGRVDLDALAFISRVIGAGGSLSTVEQSAINTLVGDLKAYGVWSSMKAIYPMVGASSASCAQNLVDSNFTGTFTSGWIFTPTGSKPNGTTAYMNTGLIPSVSIASQNSIHLSYYVNQNVKISAFQMGVRGANNVDLFIGARGYNSNLNYNVANISSANLQTETNNVSGFLAVSRITSTEFKYYKSSSLFQTTAAASTGLSNTHPIWLGTLNLAGTSYQPDDAQTVFASIGDGLTDTQVANLYTAVQRFQTTLGRQV